MAERFTVSDYAVATYEAGGNRLNFRFEAENPSWPNGRLRANELSDLVTRTLDGVGDLFVSFDSGTRLDLSSLTQHGELTYSFLRVGNIGSIHCVELLRIFKEAIWSAVDRTPLRRQSNAQTSMSCETGAMYTLSAEEKNVKVNYRIELPGWTSWAEFNSLVTAAQWWGNRLETKISTPKGQMLFCGTTSDLGMEGSAITARLFQDFTQRVANGHYSKNG